MIESLSLSVVLFTGALSKLATVRYVWVIHVEGLNDKREGTKNIQNSEIKTE